MASYELFKTSIQEAEGGYQNLEKDKGNYNSKKERVGTNFGISARFYERVIGRPPSIADMKNISQMEAHILFKNEFWDTVKASAIKHQSIAELIADHAINSNPRVTAGIVQRVLKEDFGKDIVIDRVIGTKSITAINSVDEKELFAAIAKARLEYYKGLDDYRYFKQTWTRRVVLLSKKFQIPIVFQKKVLRCS